MTEERRQVFPGDAVASRRNAIPPEIRRIQLGLFHQDRETLESIPIGTSYERDYTPGEFWQPMEEPEEVRFAGTTSVVVWRIDLFGDDPPERGYIRMRQPLPGPDIVVTDAEDAVNWLAREMPPSD